MGFLLSALFGSRTEASWLVIIIILFYFLDIPANATLAEPDSDLDDMMGPLAFYYLLIMHVVMILAMYLIDFFRKRRPKVRTEPT